MRVSPNTGAALPLSIVLAFFFLVACKSETPEIIVSIETRIVEVPVTIQVTQPPELIDVCSPRVVEKLVPAPCPTQITPTEAVSLTPTSISNDSAVFYEPHPYGSYTGIKEVDEIAQTVLKRDAGALLELYRSEIMPCIHQNDLYGPHCRDDEEIGSQVEAFSYAVCEGFWTRDEEVIVSVIEELVSSTTGVYAIYANDLVDSFGIVFTTTDNSSMILLTEQVEITSVILWCLRDPPDALEMGINWMGHENIILPPVNGD